MLNDGNITAKGSSISPTFPQQWKWPLTIKAVVHDLDGTLMPTYQTFLGVHVADQLLQKAMEQVVAARRADAAPNFISYVAQKPRQPTLHIVSKTLKALDEFASSMNITVPQQLKREVSEILDKSFQFFPGAVEALKKIDAGGAFSAIYTNSPDYFSSARLETAMERAGVNPRVIHATYTRINEDYEPLSWLDASTSAIRRVIGERMIPYAYKKPNDTPIQEIMRITGAKPHEILILGDSNGDLMTAYKDPRKPCGVFALQELGARDICEHQQHVHRKISPGAEQLGFEAVNAEIRNLGVERDIVRLPKGHLTLLHLVEEGYINFACPDVMPAVQDRKLVAAYESMPPPRVVRATGTHGLDGGPQ